MLNEKAFIILERNPSFAKGLNYRRELRESEQRTTVQQRTSVDSERDEPPKQITIPRGTIAKKPTENDKSSETQESLRRALENLRLSQEAERLRKQAENRKKIERQKKLETERREQQAQQRLKNFQEDAVLHSNFTVENLDPRKISLILRLPSRHISEITVAKSFFV